MKNLFLALISFSLLFSSCKKDELSVEDKIVGFWETSQVTANGVNVTNTIKFSFDFLENGEFGTSNTVNGQIVASSGKYFFKSSEDLVLNYDNGERGDYTVSFINDNQMKWSGSGQDANGNNLVVTLTFNK
jgi:hypothetical protein